MKIILTLFLVYVFNYPSFSQVTKGSGNFFDLIKIISTKDLDKNNFLNLDDLSNARLNVVWDDDNNKSIVKAGSSTIMFDDFSNQVCNCIINFRGESENIERIDLYFNLNEGSGCLPLSKEKQFPIFFKKNQAEVEKSFSDKMKSLGITLKRIYQQPFDYNLDYGEAAFEIISQNNKKFWMKILTSKDDAEFSSGQLSFHIFLKQPKEEWSEIY